MEQNRRVIALGFFDGVHLAHGALLTRVRRAAEELGAVPAALTFDRPPKQLTGGLINTPDDREWLMRERYGIREVIVLPFHESVRTMPWDRFVTDLLAGQLGAIHVVAGHDYRFGYQGEGDAFRLQRLCARLGVGCEIVGRVELDGITVSSTHIRKLIGAGEMEEACRFLGHPHILSGPVIHGKQLGRTIGIPTANLAIPEGVLTPAFGVYATRVRIGEQTCQAVTNVGVRPTVDSGGQVTVEPWILDYSGDLYGETIQVEFYKRLRPERKFACVEELRQAILGNARQTRSYFEGTDPEGEDSCRRQSST